MADCLPGRFGLNITLIEEARLDAELPRGSPGCWRRMAFSTLPA